MAQVDFTLDDFRGIVRDEVKQIVHEEIEQSELRITTAIKASFEDYEVKYDARHNKTDQRLDKIDAKLGRIEADGKTTRRLVGLHSKEIMELKARTS